MASRASVITVDLLELAEPFAFWCSARGLTRSTALRWIVKAALGVGFRGAAEPCPRSGSRAVAHAIDCREAMAAARHITVRFSSEEVDQMRVRCAQTGLPPGRYLVAAMAADCKGVSVADKELASALRESCFRLAGLHRHLGRARRSMVGERGAELEQTAVPAVDLPALADEIGVHLQWAAVVLDRLDLSKARHKPTGSSGAGRRKES